MRKLESLVDRYFEGSAAPPEDRTDPPPRNPRVAAVILIGLVGAFVWTLAFLYKIQSLRQPSQASSAHPVNELVEP